MMIAPAGLKVHLALGYTDMRKGMDGLAMLVQDVLKKDPFSGHLFAATHALGRSSERINPDRLPLGLKDLDGEIGARKRNR